MEVNTEGFEPMEPMAVTNDRTAILIDGDSMSPAQVDRSLTEACRYGVPVVKMLFRNSYSQNFNKVLKKHLVQFVLTGYGEARKNCSDSALIIEAMKLIDRPQIQTFIIVTSDSDFAPLISELRLLGKTTVVIDTGNAGRSLENVCDDFVARKSGQKDNSDRYADLRKAIDEAIQVYAGSGKPLVISRLYDCLKMKNPGFDYRAEGFGKWSTLLKELGYQLKRGGSNYTLVC